MFKGNKVEYTRFVSSDEEKKKEVPKLMKELMTNINWDSVGPSRSSVLGTPKVFERELFKSVMSGNVNQVKNILRSQPQLSVNCVNYQGYSPLHLALKNNDKSMIDYLLKRKDIDVMDCALHAIQLEMPLYLQLIFQKMVEKNNNPEIEKLPYTGSIDFPGYMTPMMLAAQCGNSEIIDILISRGHPEIPRPHKHSCSCNDCLIALDEEDHLISTFKTYDTYKAICNPVYINRLANDPILMVFYLADELMEMAEHKRALRSKYEELAQNTQTYAADLIGLCRTSDEVRIILNEREGSRLKGDFLFPRLILAVDYKQKLFVAQTNVQEVLEAAWVGDWYEWKTYTSLRRVFHAFGRMIMLICLYIFCIFLPKSTQAQFYSIPVNRMLSSVSSYLIFLCLLFLESHRDKKDQTRYDFQKNIKIKLFIFVYILSHILNSFRMWALQGSARFFAFKWNIYDLITELLFAMTVAFWISAYITLSTLPDLERKYWHYLDPQLLAEGLFCIGTVMAFMKLLLLIQMNYILGPMQVSLGKMTVDFSRFFVIFTIVIGSFTAGLCRLYDYYDGMKQIDPETKSESEQEGSFVGPLSTFDLLFWGLFGMSSQDASDVVIENLPSENGELESINTHDFTQAVGYTLFGVYTVLTVVVLLNMLIAAMSNSFQAVTENVDVEWIFGRTKVYLIYMSQTVLPPPLIFPAGVGVGAWSAVFTNVLQKWFPQKELTEAEEPPQEDFNEVINKLKTRYMSMKTVEE
ncbi:short transient receptor potential channel 4-like [Homalodisca vitripennis]|nr:short transient receptor potential channel 4-like [Homalodisca vitripennis]